MVVAAPIKRNTSPIAISSNPVQEPVNGKLRSCSRWRQIRKADRTGMTTP
jgi:hypothetical protein